MKFFLLYIKRNTPKFYAINQRSVTSMIREWRVHNLVYSIGLYRRRTKDVDFEHPQKWYFKVAYFILSPFYLHFK